MKSQALKINTWGKNVYVKIPVTNSKGVFMGKIIKELNNMNIKLNITAIYNYKQTEKILKLINKIKKFGKSYDHLTTETVKAFYDDAKSAGFKI